MDGTDAAERRRRHEANRAWWNRDVVRGWGQKDPSRSWRQVWEDPDLAADPGEWELLGEVAGREVCVLGSGDNLLVFALAARGARVTSVDISERQLAVAAGRAEELGVEIDFVRADIADLGGLATGSFDLVHTGGHVAVWLADPGRAYAEAARILRPGGLLVVGEYHPFRRLWRQEVAGFELETPYFDRGPHRYEEDGLVAYEHHWTVADLVGAVTAAGLGLEHLGEYGDGAEGWERNDLRGLPRLLLIAGRKPPGPPSPPDDLTIEPLGAERVAWLRDGWSVGGGSKSAGYFEAAFAAQERGELVVFVARRGEELQGYVKLAWTSGYPPFATAGIPEIQDLNVLPAAQRRGVGSALLDAVEAAAGSRATEVGLAVGLHPGYGPAQRLYALRGYVPDARPVCFHDRPVTEMQEVVMDNDLVLHLTKVLS